MDRTKQVRVESRLASQQGVVAVWQLVEDDLTVKEIRGLVADWRLMHRGVYLTGHAPPTLWQRCFAANLTENGTLLARWSMAALLDLRTLAVEEPLHVVREGSGGRRKYEKRQGRLDALDVRHSETLALDRTTLKGIEGTTAARTLMDLFVDCGSTQSDRLFRDAIRKKVVTRQELRDLTRAHRGERGVGRIRELLSVYDEIPIERTRSDPEIQGLVVLRDAGEPLPQVNIEIANFEADFVDLDRREITELDGPQFHQFPERDRERNEAWKAAGFTVRRQSTDTPYDDPDEFVRVARG